MEEIGNLWSLQFIKWITAGGAGLLNILILLSFFGTIYGLYLVFFAIFFRKSIRETHETALSNIEDSYIYTTVGAALNDFGTAFARAIAGVIKGIATPVQLFFSTLNGVVFAPLEKWIEKKQQEIENRNQSDQVWKMVQTKKEIERIKMRATQNRMLHEVRKEAKEAKIQGRLTNFTNQADIQKMIEGSNENEEDSKPEILDLDDNCDDVIGYANLCTEGLKAGILQNLSVNSVAEFLSCTEFHAKKVRNHLVKIGIAHKHNNGRLTIKSDRADVA